MRAVQLPEVRKISPMIWGKEMISKIGHNEH